MTEIGRKARGWSGLATRTAAWTAAIGAAMPVASLAAREGASPLVLLASGLGGVATAAPFAGLLVVAGLVPLSAMLAWQLGFSTSGGITAEILVLAFLAGWLLRVGWDQTSGVSQRVLAPMLALGALIVSSAMVSAARGVPYDSNLLTGLLASCGQALAEFTTRPILYHPLYPAVRWLSLIALAAACASSAGRPTVSDRRRALLRMLAISLCGAALLNVIRYFQLVLASENPFHAARTYLWWMRINLHYVDVNAAGSVLTMLGLLLIGFVRTGRRTTVPAIALLVTLAALWLAGSRTAWAAFIVAVAGGVLAERGLRWSRRSLVLGTTVILSALAVGVLMIWQSPRGGANVAASEALSIRTELMHRSLRMVREHPVFGVGVGNYYRESYRYASPSAPFKHENAHNDGAQIVAELGIPGLALFVWLLFELLRRLLRLRLNEPRSLQAWWLTSVAGFLLTGLAGHPLIVFESALPFWLAVGAAADDRAWPLERQPTVGILVVAALCVALPVRLLTARAQTIQEGPSLVWEVDDEMTFRDVGETDLLVLQQPIETVSVPVRLRGGHAADAFVDIELDGHRVNRVPVQTDRWLTHRLVLPRTGSYVDRRLRLTLVGAPKGVRLLVGRPILH